MMQWRPLRLRILFPYLLSFLALPLLYLVLNNNAYDALQANMMIRMAFGLNLIVFCAVFCQMLAFRRPPWAWSRSLPQSSRRRVLYDASGILAYITPLIILSGFVSIRMTLFLICGTPGLVFVAVAANRGGDENRLGVSGRILGKTIPPLLLFVIFPWVSIVYLLLTPLLMSAAVFEDMSLPVSRWEARHHLSEGDSQAWAIH